MMFKLKKKHRIVGTPDYIAPEIILGKLGKGDASPMVDI